MVMRVQWVVVGSLMCLMGCQSRTESGMKQESASSQASGTPSATVVRDEAKGGESINNQPRHGLTAKSEESNNASPSRIEQPKKQESSLPNTDVRRWLLQSSGPDEAARLDALDSLNALGELSVRATVEILRADDLAVRRAAVSYLVGRVGARNKQVIQALVEALSSDDALLRHRAFHALEGLPSQPLQCAVPALANMLTNSDEEESYRVRAARTIGRMQQNARTATAVLERVALEDPNQRVRRAAFAAMTKVADPKVADRFFAKFLAGDNPTELRRLAAKWLGRVARSEQSLRGLVAALNDPDKDVRKTASDSLVTIGRPAVPALIRALQSSSVQQRRYAIFALGKMGPLAAAAAPALKKHAEDPNPEISKLAVAALRLVSGG